MHFIHTCGNGFLLTVKMNLFNHFINYCIVKYNSVLNIMIDRNYDLVDSKISAKILALG